MIPQLLLTVLNVLKSSVLPQALSAITLPIMSILRMRVVINPADRAGWLLLLVYAAIGLGLTYFGGISL